MIDKKILQRESNLLTDIKVWNIRFPFDLTWRRKYGIPFGSKDHKDMCLFDIKFDVEEDNLINKIVVETMNDKKNKEAGKNEKQLLKNRVRKKLIKEEIDEAFEELDLDSFNNLKI